MTEVLTLAYKFPNFHIDTSAYAARRYPRELVGYLRDQGARRVLFGTNYPMLTARQAMTGLDALGLTPEVLAAFLRTTPRACSGSADQKIAPADARLTCDRVERSTRLGSVPMSRIWFITTEHGRRLVDAKAAPGGSTPGALRDKVHGMKLPLSVLDLSPVGAGVAPSAAVRDSVELAVLADQLGYTRYWFAEHHSMPSIATSAPEVLIAHTAARTTRIRLGAGGIMVPNHAPLHVVEVFRTLEALAPGRVDLGLGRAPGTDRVTAAALRRADIEVNDLLAELLAFEDDRFPERHPFKKVVPMPSDVRAGAIWMLGSTLAGASIAARLGVPYAFAGHFAMHAAREAIAHYRRSFEPSARLARPYAMCAVTTICAESDDEAQRLAAPMRVAVVNTRTGKSAPIVSIEDALARKFTPEEQAICDSFLEGAVLGGPSLVAERLPALARELEADELMLSTLVPGLEARRASLERIAAALA